MTVIETTVPTLRHSGNADNPSNMGGDSRMFIYKIYLLTIFNSDFSLRGCGIPKDMFANGV
jgi:hypothetical protein